MRSRSRTVTTRASACSGFGLFSLADLRWSMPSLKDWPGKGWGVRGAPVSTGSVLRVATAFVIFCVGAASVLAARSQCVTYGNIVSVLAKLITVVDVILMVARRWPTIQTWCITSARRSTRCSQTARFALLLGLITCVHAMDVPSAAASTSSMDLTAATTITMAAQKIVFGSSSSSSSSSSGAGAGGGGGGAGGAAAAGSMGEGGEGGELAPFPALDSAALSSESTAAKSRVEVSQQGTNDPAKLRGEPTRHSPSPRAEYVGAAEAHIAVCVANASRKSPAFEAMCAEFGADIASVMWTAQESAILTGQLVGNALLDPCINWGIGA